MKTCKNCIYHEKAVPGEDIYPCVKLNETINTAYRENDEEYFGIEIWSYINNRWCVGGITNKNKRKYIISTPNWFSCVFHVKKEKNKL